MVSRCEKDGERSLLKQLADHPYGTESYFTSGTRDKEMHTLEGTTILAAMRCKKSIFEFFRNAKEIF